MSDTATLSIPQDMIQPIIQAKVHAAIVEAFGKSEQIISAVAEQVCKTKVSSRSGKVDTYSSCNDVTLIEYLASQAIREAAEKAVREWMGKNAAHIRRSVWARLDDKKSGIRDKIANAYMAALIENKWDLQVSVQPRSQE